MNAQTLLKKLDSDYAPKFFNSSIIDEFLKNNEKKVVIVLRIPENEKAYVNFDKDFSIYLGKLPNSPLKKAIGFLYNKKLIFYGTAKNTDGKTYSRVLISKNEKLAGVVLNAYALDISLRDGTTPSIDECIYASYFGLIRAAVIIHKQEVKRDKELLRYLTNVLSILILKILGKHITIDRREKSLIQLICIYLFYRQFLEEKHTSVVKTIHKKYGDLFTADELKTYSSYLEKLKTFSNFKDIPQIIQLFGLADINPSQLMMILIRALGANGLKNN